MISSIPNSSLAQYASRHTIDDMIPALHIKNESIAADGSCSQDICTMSAAASAYLPLACPDSLQVACSWPCCHNVSNAYENVNFTLSEYHVVCRVHPASPHCIKRCADNPDGKLEHA